MLTPNELVLTFRGSYVCANFGENRSKNVTVRVLADGQTHRQTDRQTDANRFYNLSHAICYSYGTDNQEVTGRCLLRVPSLPIGVTPYIPLIRQRSYYYFRRFRCRHIC